MTALAIVAVSCTYATLGLGVGRALAGHLAYRMAENYVRKYPHVRTGHPLVGQWLGAWMIALPLLAIWPIVLVIPRLTRLAPHVGAEAEAQRRAHQARIHELERELEIR